MSVVAPGLEKLPKRLDSFFGGQGPALECIAILAELEGQLCGSWRNQTHFVEFLSLGEDLTRLTLHRNPALVQ